MKTKSKKELRFPILKDVEYVSISKDRRSVLEIEGKNLDNFSWREFQLYLGKYLPPDQYRFTMKFNNNAEIHNGLIHAVTLNKQGIESKTMESDKILKEFEGLKKSLEKATNQGGVSFDMLLSATKQGYEARIDYLNAKIADKDLLISEIKKEIDILEDDLSECEKENAKHGGIAQYLAIGEKVLNMKFGKQPPISLKDSNTSDIPQQILEVLGVIDWNKIDPESINKIAVNIQQYLSVIPSQFFKGA